MHPLELQKHVRKIIEPTLSRLGIDVVAVEWRGGILKLSIDKDGGVSMQDCVLVTHSVSPLLDEDDPIAGRYRLEVGSPGIDRPVQREADFVKFSGYRAKIRLVEGYPRRRYTGTLKGVDGDDVLVEADGTEHRLSFDSIERAELVLDLDEYQRLASGPLSTAVAEETSDDDL